MPLHVPEDLNLRFEIENPARKREKIGDELLIAPPAVIAESLDMVPGTTWMIRRQRGLLQDSGRREWSFRAER